ncbi:MAG: phosphodiester glycosidase family protein [Prosthecobacter sp.]|nr:phosphodiester glycosidase family protein [Prosthecobacter sp.]
MAEKKRGCLKSLLLVLLAGMVVLWVAGEWYFNLGSNLVALSVRDSKQSLQVRSRRGVWKLLSALTPADLHQALIERHSETGLRWSTINVRRSDGILSGIAQKLLGAQVHVVTLAPEHFEFMTTFRPKFALTTAAERLESDNLWFAITANFRDPKGKPLGWVWHEGMQVNPSFPEWSGAFFVKGGRPWFGPRSLVDEVPGPIEEGAQGYPSVMKNHTVFPYVELKPDRFFDGSKITYRALAGMRRDGTIVFILSGDGGVMNVAEVTELARKLDLQHATLLDGGRALQYSIRTEDGPWHFAAYNTRIETRHPWFEQQRSPVYIGARRRAPEIITMRQP